MNRLFLMMLLSGAIMIAGCNTGPESPRGFSLPEGDPAAGRTAFLDLGCNACHSIGDISQMQSDPPAYISVHLGGKSPRVKTYAELVTSVINPSHRLAKGYPAEMIQSAGESKMPDYNSIMTVEQLVDVVTFLQSNYELERFIPTTYPRYPIK